MTQIIPGMGIAVDQGGQEVEPEERDPLTYAIIGAAMEVHGEHGPGYLEGVYHESMEVEFELRDMGYVSEPEMRIEYKGRPLKKHYRPDFVVYGAVPVELKAHSEPLSNADGKQILNALKCADLRVGLLINFGRKSLEWRRFINEY